MSNPTRILIVDDEPDILSLLTLHLQLKHYHVFKTSSPIKAIEIANKEKPDLILLDVMMPEMDGFQVAAKLKQNDDTSTIPIIFLTARTQTEDKIKGFKAGADDYLVKPFDFEELEIRINRLIKKKDEVPTSTLILRYPKNAATMKLAEWIKTGIEFHALKIQIVNVGAGDLLSVKEDFLLSVTLSLRERDNGHFIFTSKDDSNDRFVLFTTNPNLEKYCKNLIQLFKQNSRDKADLKIMVYPKQNRKNYTAEELMTKFLD
ncbi:MAG: response regulator [Caldisericia bacterium]|nr:response regulator [Caldisericia bacterium]MDD4614530.1 response regulator [Caldisericia bacterium]